MTGLAYDFTSNSANVYWNPVAGASFYRVEYKLATASTWTVATTTTNNSYTLTGLLSATAYEIRVQTTCSSGIVSPYSATIAFTTLGASCAAPINLAASNIATNSAVISWTAISGATNYAIEFTPSTNPSAWSITVQTTTPFTLYGLQANTTYLMRIKTLCGNVYSAYAPTITFTTLPTPTCSPIPTNLAVSNITTSSATLTWNPVSGATAYDINFAISTNPTMWSYTLQTATPYTLYGLQANSTYLVRIRTRCSNNAFSDYSPITYFTTPNTASGCNTPTGLAASNITGTTALMTWNTVGGAINYSLEYAATNNPTYWITSTPNTNAFSLYNLQTNTQYQVRVKTVCGGGASSGYSSNLIFSTAASQTINGAFSPYIASKTNRANTMDIAPNPTTGKFNVIFALTEQSTIDLELTDITGQLLRSEKLTLQEGQYPMDIQQLPSGVYFVRARINEKELLVKKVIK